MITQDGGDGDDNKDTDVISNAQTNAQTNAAGPSMLSSEEFDAEQYLKDYPDVARAIAQGAFGRDPYNHYMAYGFKEGRTAKPKSVTPPTTPPTAPKPPTGTPEERFRAVMKGLPSTPKNLKAKEAELKAAGFKVLTNASGVSGKVSYEEDGKTIIRDVIRSAGTGGQENAEEWQWLGDDGGAGGAGGTSSGNFTPYSGPDFTGNTPLGDLARFTPPPNTMGQFNAPEGSGKVTPFDFGQMQGPTQQQAPTPYTPGQVRYDPVTNQPIQASSASAPQYAAQSAGDAQTATAQQMNASNAITGRDVTGPAALQSTNLGAADKFQGVSKADLESDPSYQFRLSQGLGAIQNSAAAKGALRTGGTLKGLNDYAGQSASQEYQNVYGRKLGEFNNAFAQGAQVNQQNNSNQAQAYGLTNQYGQAAQMANQQNAYNVQSQNAQNQMQSGMFNVGQANQIAQQNAQNQNQMRQFNTGQSNTVGMQNAGNQLQANLSNAQMAQQASTQNASNALQAGQFNSNLGYQANAQNVQNGMTAAQQNYQNQFNAVNANNATNLGYNQQAYGQAATTYGLNQANQQQAYQQAQNAYATNLGAQNQQYSQAAGTYGLNLSANQQQYLQNLEAWKANVNAQMGYGQYNLADSALRYTQAGGD